MIRKKRKCVLLLTSSASFVLISLRYTIDILSNYFNEMSILEDLVRICFIGAGSLGGLIGVLCTFLFMKISGVQLSLFYAIIGGTLGALLSSGLVLLTGVWLIIRTLI